MSDTAPIKKQHETDCPEYKPGECVWNPKSASTKLATNLRKPSSAAECRNPKIVCRVAALRIMDYVYIGELMTCVDCFFRCNLTKCITSYASTKLR